MKQGNCFVLPSMSLEPMDREVLVLRHFEALSNDDVANRLGLTKSAATKRYVRALVP